MGPSPIFSQKNLAEKIVIVARTIEHIANKYILEPHGLSMSSFEILYAIDMHESATPTLLLSCRGGTKSNISQRLNFLEKNGYIKRVYAKNLRDRREVMLRLTSLGKRKLQEVAKILEEKTILLESIVSKDEVKKHSLLLDKIFEKLAKHQTNFKNQI